MLGNTVIELDKTRIDNRHGKSHSQHKKDRYFTQFKEYITSNGLLFNISNQKEQVLTYLYAEFSKQLFNDTSYYQIVLPKDKMIKKVLEKRTYRIYLLYFLIIKKRV